MSHIRGQSDIPVSWLARRTELRKDCLPKTPFVEKRLCPIWKRWQKKCWFLHRHKHIISQVMIKLRFGIEKSINASYNYFIDHFFSMKLGILVKYISNVCLVFRCKRTLTASVIFWKFVWYIIYFLKTFTSSPGSTRFNIKLLCESDYSFSSSPLPNIRSISISLVFSL